MLWDEAHPVRDVQAVRRQRRSRGDDGGVEKLCIQLAEVRTPMEYLGQARTPAFEHDADPGRPQVDDSTSRAVLRGSFHRPPQHSRETTAASAAAYSF